MQADTRFGQKVWNLRSEQKTVCENQKDEEDRERERGIERSRRTRNLSFLLPQFIWSPWSRIK